MTDDNLSDKVMDPCDADHSATRISPDSIIIPRLVLPNKNPTDSPAKGCNLHERENLLHLVEDTTTEHQANLTECSCSLGNEYETIGSDDLAHVERFPLTERFMVSTAPTSPVSSNKSFGKQDPDLGREEAEEEDGDTMDNDDYLVQAWSYDKLYEHHRVILAHGQLCHASALRNRVLAIKMRIELMGLQSRQGQEMPEDDFVSSALHDERVDASKMVIEVAIRVLDFAEPIHENTLIRPAWELRSWAEEQLEAMHAPKFDHFD